MSEVRFVFPKPRLAQILKMPGGLPVVEALERAQANLEAVKPTCVAELQALLELSEARFEKVEAGAEAQAIADLYAIAVRGIGGGVVCGLPGVDVALTSLCDLIDHLQTHDRYDRQSVEVHLRAWRLLMNPALPQLASDSVIDGLRKVSRRYAAPA